MASIGTPPHQQDNGTIPTPSSEKMSHLDINSTVVPHASDHAPVESAPPVEAGTGGEPVAVTPVVNGLANGNSHLSDHSHLPQSTEADAEISLQPTIPAPITSPSIAEGNIPDISSQSLTFDSIPSDTTAASVAPQVDAPTSSARDEHEIRPVSVFAGEPKPVDPILHEKSSEPTEPKADLMDTTEDVQRTSSEPVISPPPGSLTPSEPKVAELSESNLESVNAASSVPETNSAAPIETDSMVAQASVVDTPAFTQKTELTVDTEMQDVPASPGKVPRPRDDDAEDGEDGRASKRTRTEDDGSAAPEFKIPDMPQADTSPPAGSGGALSTNGSSGVKSITKAQNKFLLSAVRNVKRTKDAKWFNEPVDAVKLGLPTYYDVVKNPMDLKSVEAKLKEEVYNHVDEVVSDIDLVVLNARAFNGPDHMVTKAAESMKAAFEKSLPNVPKPDVVEPTPAEKKAKKLAPGGPMKDPGSRRPSRTAATAASPTGGESSPRFALKEGVPIIRRDSIATDGRPKREIKPAQPRDLPYSASKPKKKKFQWELRFCQHVLDEMTKPKHAAYSSPFLYPVDPVALNIPTYHQIIKKPMDISLIQKKLKDGEYEKFTDFEADVRLIFANCYKFNVPGDVVYAMGKSYEKIFDSKVAGKAAWLEAHTPASAPQTPESMSEEEEEEEEESEEDEAAAELEKLKKQIAALSENIEQINKVKAKKQKEKTTKAKPSKKATKKESKHQAQSSNAKGDKKKSKGGKKESKIPYVTYDMKQEISTSINNLPVDKMGHALTIIRENMPSLKGTEDEDMELDIDELSQETLWKLLTYVRKHAPSDDPAPVFTSSSKSHHTHKSDNAHVPRPKKKNKPMSKTEQEARIREMKSKLAKFESGSMSPSMGDDDDDSSGDDDDPSGSESEEE